jgi:hypothetical protein
MKFVVWFELLTVPEAEEDGIVDELDSHFKD